MATSTPGEGQNLEGITILLSAEHGTGRDEGEAFRVVKFETTTSKGGRNILAVHLYRLRDDKFFKGNFNDPAQVVGNSGLPMDVVANNLEEIFRGVTDRHTVISYDNADKMEILQIKTVVKTKICNRAVSFKFCYKFKNAAMYFEDSINKKLAEYAQIIKEKTNDPVLFFSGKSVTGARFDVSRNNYHSVSDCGKILTHHDSTQWNTTPISTLMNHTVAHRARFRVVSRISTMLFGVISNQFDPYTEEMDHSSPNPIHSSHFFVGAGHYGWMALFYDSKLRGSFEHNGSFQYRGGPPYDGSIVTVEYYPRQGRIQYFVNNVPAGQHIGCSFTYGDSRFSVALATQGDKVKLLSVEQITDSF